MKMKKGKKMTIKERAIIMAYTGVCTLTGNKLKYFYKYCGKLLGKKEIFTHELALNADRIKELSKKDFISICK